MFLTKDKSLNEAVLKLKDLLRGSIFKFLITDEMKLMMKLYQNSSFIKTFPLLEQS